MVANFDDNEHTNYGLHDAASAVKRANKKLLTLKR